MSCRPGALNNGNNVNSFPVPMGQAMETRDALEDVNQSIAKYITKFNAAVDELNSNLAPHTEECMICMEVCNKVVFCAHGCTFKVMLVCVFLAGWLCVSFWLCVCVCLSGCVCVCLSGTDTSLCMRKCRRVRHAPLSSTSARHIQCLA